MVPKDVPLRRATSLNYPKRKQKQNPSIAGKSSEEDRLNDSSDKGTFIENRLESEGLNYF